MKATCYLRIGKKRRGFAFRAGVKPNAAPIPSSPGFDPPYPTILVKLNLELPADAFGPDAEVDVTVPPGAIEILAEVHE